MKLRILHKGLILLLIPAILQGFLLFQLYTSFREVDRLSREEEKISTALSIGDRIVSLVTRVLRNTWRAGKSSSEPMLDPEVFRTRMHALTSEEQTLLADDPDVSKLMQMLISLTDDTYRLLKEAPSADLPASDLDRMIALAPRLKTLGMQQVIIDAIKTKQFESLRIKRENTRASRSRIETQIFLSAIAEVVLTLALLLYFLQDVTKRLKVLMRNAASVPKGKPLTVHVGGGDELAYLDDVLHEASAELESAAQHRKVIAEMLSHDLRAPLLSANVSLDLLLRQDALDSRDEHDKRVNGIKRNLAKLTSFVEDLLTIDQLESGKLKLSLEAVDLHSVAAESCDDLAALAQDKNVTLKNSLVTQEVVADKNRLHQVLVNLISNAIKFSPSGATVLVSSEVTQQQVTVSVVDQGPGIPPAQQAQLFQRFHQVDNPGLSSSFGLGLYISTLIVERHAGHMGVESEPGKGARFWFSLPVDDSDDDPDATD